MGAKFGSPLIPNSMYTQKTSSGSHDWKKKKRSELDLIGRVKPSTWGKYPTGNLVLKISRNYTPIVLNNALHRTLYTDGRRPNSAKFFDTSNSLFGYQAIQNRIGDLFDIFNFDNYNIILNDDKLRSLLKRVLSIQLNPRHGINLDEWTEPENCTNQGESTEIIVDGVQAPMLDLLNAQHY